MKAKLSAICHYLEDGLIERSVAVRLSLLSALSGENLLLLGPPGTAKSELARKLHQVFSEVNYFERLLTRFSVPEELFGPLSIKALEDDRYQRLTKNYLPEASIAFIDEVFKANSAILNALLTLLNEREFDNGVERIQTPLISVIAASNELPEDETLDALYDRFLLRYQLDVVSDDGFNALLDLDTNTALEPPALLNMAELDQLQDNALSIKLTDDARQLILALRDYVKQQGIYISDRRWRKIIKLLKVAAHSNQQSEVTQWDCALILHCCWQLPEQLNNLQQWFIQQLALDYSADVQRFNKVLNVWQTKLSDNQNNKIHQKNAQGQKLYRDDKNQLTTRKESVTLAERDNEVLYLAPGKQEDRTNNGKGYTLQELEQQFFDDSMKQTHIDGKWMDLRNYVNNTQNRLVHKIQFEPITEAVVYDDDYINNSVQQLQNIKTDVMALHQHCTEKDETLTQLLSSHLWLDKAIFLSSLDNLKNNIAQLQDINLQINDCIEGFHALTLKQNTAVPNTSNI